MLKFLSRRLDDLITGVFLLAVFTAAVLWPPVFATSGGQLLTQAVLGSICVLTVALLVGARFSGVAGQVLRLVLAFAPIVVAVVGYVSLKLLHASSITSWLAIPSRDHWMMAADTLLFGKTPLLYLGGGWLGSELFLRAMAGLYAAYPFTPLAAMAWFYFKGDVAQFRLIRRAMVISLYLGYCCYVLVPVSGPLSLMGPGARSFLQSTETYTFLADNFRYGFDCFPSLHTANPWLIVWLCRGRLPGWVMTASIAVCVGITFSTIALKVHYGIDDVAGLAWALLMAQLARATMPCQAAA